LTAVALASRHWKSGTLTSTEQSKVMLHLLDLKIDYRDALVNFEYDPDKHHF
jgi:hypothetical protein